jgi:hypothetical protein
MVRIKILPMSINLLELVSYPTQPVFFILTSQPLIARKVVGTIRSVRLKPKNVEYNNSKKIGSPGGSSWQP